MPPRTSRKKKTATEEESTNENPVCLTPTENRSQENARHDHVVVQLSIPSKTIDDIVNSENFRESLEYRPEIEDPIPYQACDFFESQQGNLSPIEENSRKQTIKASNEPDQPSVIGTPSFDNAYQEHRLMCFWCCHDIGASRFGMPVAYDANHKSFSMYGHFCSLECSAAHNFSVHMGCDRMWEIHSWIQLYARQIGYGTPVRPAPNRYLLKMFGGPLSIDEFQAAHKGTARTVVLNIPPLINIQSQVESINTSFLFKSKQANAAATEPTGSGLCAPSLGSGPNIGCSDKSKFTRSKSFVDQNKTLDFKMNLSYE
jgi:hypothetical protein